MRPVSRRKLLWLGLGVLVAGCLSPTLPLPPPDRPKVTEISQGVYELNGSLPMAGTVVAQNLRTTELNGLTVDQVYKFTVHAEPGDGMSLWYEPTSDSDFYGDRSPTISFDIPDRTKFPVSDAGAKADGAP